jgi:signal transduction histidine kinase
MTPAGVQLLVEDGGPGLPVPRPGDAGDLSPGGSTGLGLDIARRTAEAAGGTMRVAESALGGALVALTLPPLP